jgi:hypothetical protein
MNRRQFVTVGAASLSLIPWLGHPQSISRAPDLPTWLADWIAINDRHLANYTPLRVTDARHRFVGGYRNDADIPNPQTTSGFLMLASLLLSRPESIHYRSPALVESIDAAARAILVMQHTDGTIDLPETNFHSTPDTAFVLENVIPAFTFLTAATASGTEPALRLLQTFLTRAGEALVVGGIHTPNHRWVVSAALTRLNALFPDRRNTQRIEQWLAEHIDIDPDGQFNEKSTNSYSPIVNQSLIIMARGLNKPELLEPVRRNLLMTLYYVHPNGEVVTEASNRQDKGTIGTMIRYYYAYRFMALNDKNGEMAALCRLIEKTCPKEQLAVFLPYFLEDPTLWSDLPASKPLPTNYAKAFPYSGVVRIRRDVWDATILANNAGWLTVHKGQAVLQAVRMATSFFGKGQFLSEKVEQQGDAWVLTSALDGPYYQPIAPDKIAADGDWDKMARADRPQSEVQHLRTKVSIRETANGLQIDIDSRGTDGVPVALELIFRPGGTLTGLSAHPKKTNAWLLAAETGTYTVGTDTIRFGPGRADHSGIQLRGALPALDAPTVYLTGYTPFTHQLFIR